MKYLLSKNFKSLELRGNFKLKKAIENLTKYFKKLVVLSLLATLAITTGACDGQKTSSTSGDDKPVTSVTNKTQLETLGIDESKAFFVTPSGKKTNDGSSWQKAMDLQSAIDAAATDATKKFVLVAKGSYYADPNKTDITKSFQLKDKVKIYGGFDVNAKKLTRYKDASILEGKLSNSLNSGLILEGTNLSATSILDGFLIQNALNTDYYTKGAGVYLYKSQLQLNNLTFNNNKLTHKLSSGGAIYSNSSSPSISNSSFSNNSANDGGAIYNALSSPKIHNSIFSNNSANGRGGAIDNYYQSSPSISNSSFSNNSAEWGGAIDNYYKSSPSISNSSFNNNSAEWGGAIFNQQGSDPKIYNSILWNNRDKHKGTEAINNIYNRDVADKPIIKNSILNANSVVFKKSSGYKPQDYKQAKAYNFMNFNDAKFKANQTPATFSIDVRGKVASANQVLIKDKGDNALYLEVYDKIKDNSANTTSTIPNEDKDLAGNSRLQGSKIDIGAYELQE